MFYLLITDITNRRTVIANHSTPNIFDTTNALHAAHKAAASRSKLFKPRTSELAKQHDRRFEDLTSRYHGVMTPAMFAADLAQSLDSQWQNHREDLFRRQERCPLLICGTNRHQQRTARLSENSTPRAPNHWNVVEYRFYQNFLHTFTEQDQKIKEQYAKGNYFTRSRDLLTEVRVVSKKKLKIIIIIIH